MRELRAAISSVLVDSEQGLFRLFQSVQCHISGDSGEPLQEALQAVSGFEVVEQSAQQNPCASKGGFTGHNRGISNDDRLHVFSVHHLRARCCYRSIVDALTISRPAMAITSGWLSSTLARFFAAPSGPLRWLQRFRRLLHSRGAPLRYLADSRIAGDNELAGAQRLLLEIQRIGRQDLPARYLLPE